MIEHVSGSVVGTQYVNLDYVVEFNPKGRRLVCCYGDKGQRVFILTEKSAEELEKMLNGGLGADSMKLLLQQQRDLDACKHLFINIMGWCNGMFREGTAFPAIAAFDDVSGDINDMQGLVMESLLSLNNEYMEMKGKLEEAGITPDDSNGDDPDKQ